MNIVKHTGYWEGAYIVNSNEEYSVEEIEHKYDKQQTVIKTKNKLYNVHPAVRNDDDKWVYPIRYEYTQDYERAPEHFTRLIQETVLTGFGPEKRTVKTEPL